MQRVIGLEHQVDSKVLLELFKNRIGSVQSSVDDGVDANDHVLTFVEVAHLHQLPPDLERNGGIRLDPAAAAAIRASLRQRTLQALAHPLARHLDQPELGDLQDLRFRSILLDLFLERFEQAGPVAEVLHVDEVEDDDAPEVAQANLPHDFLGGLQVRPEDRLLEILLSDVLAGVHVDRHQRLGLVDHDVAARAEPDLRLERFGDLRLDAELLEDRLVAPEEAHAGDERRLNVVEELHDPLVLLDRIDPYALELGREDVADRSQDQVEIVV